MQLEIDNLGGSRFTSLWGKYVTGFSSEHHCLACLKGVQDTRVSKEMSADPLTLRSDMPYFYLCALGSPRSALSNVHLAVQPRPGSVACVGSIYGTVFTIRDAMAIRIKSLPKGWRSEEDSFTQCPNFQFAVQTFGFPVADGGLDFGRDVLFPKPLEAGEL